MTGLRPLLLGQQIFFIPAAASSVAAVQSSFLKLEFGCASVISTAVVGNPLATTTEAKEAAASAAATMLDVVSMEEDPL
jgi:hypothetical protein